MYQGRPDMLGLTSQELPFTACHNFQPSVLEGQLCYSLNLTNIKTKLDKKKELLLLLDPGTSKEQDFPLRIKVHMLAPYTDFRSGRYAMTAIKKISGTESFMGLPESERNCQSEEFEGCYKRKYFSRVQEMCGCIPLSLSSNNEVRSFQNLALSCLDSLWPSRLQVHYGSSWRRPRLYGSLHRPLC